MKFLNVVLLGLLATTIGCNQSNVTQNDSAASNHTADSQYVVSTEPVGAIAVGKARDSVQDEQSVTLVGTIGGSSEPFVKGLAAFTIVDSKIPFCAAEEGCPTPWDYCCTQDLVKGNIATVKIVDDAGKPVTDDARKLLGVKELTTVVVQGKAKRDDQGNLTVSANKVFVRPGE